MSAEFSAGDRVRVRDLDVPGHVRTPKYVRGKPGEISKLLGEFRNPEDLAYGGSGLPEKSLYKVGFRQVELWSDYTGAQDDKLHIDLYEHWLDPEPEENA